MASLAPRTGVLGKRLAAHLLRRTTFGPTRAEIDDFATKTAEDAVELLMNFPLSPPHPKDPTTNNVWVVNGRTTANSSDQDLKHIISAWWLHQLFDPNIGLTAAHKIFFFLHTSFVTGHNTIEYSENFYYSLRLLMLYTNDSYKELAKKICLDNGMNDFLDIGDSIKGNPNENFVREFFELYTIGKGPQIGPGDYTTFTEQDVTEAARLMTGYRRNDSWADPTLMDPVTNLPRAKLDPSRHDETDKMFSPAFQDTVILGRNTQQGMLDEVDDFVEMIFAQDATAQEIVRRMYRFFVRYKISPEVETDIIIPLAATLKANGYFFIPVLKELLKSVHFYDEDDGDGSDETIGALIKSPMDLQVGMMRYFRAPVPDPEADPFYAYVTYYRWGMLKLLSDACFDLFEPPEVAGYQPVYQGPEYNRLWISAKSLPARYQIAEEHVFSAPDILFDVMALVTDPTFITDYSGNDPQGTPGPHQGARIGNHLVEELVSYLLPETLDTDRFNYFLNDILLDSLSLTNWMFEWDAYIATGDDSSVKPQIQKLLQTILQSPEYQLS